jgi:phosphoenolpyruvate carboxykinase (ATP)
VRAALDGSLERVPFEEEPHLGLRFPAYCPGLRKLCINPKALWEDPSAYTAKAQELAQLFREQLRHFRDLR